MEKSERGYGSTNNPEKFLAMDFLEYADPVRYKTLWSSIITNPLTGTYHYPKTLNYPFNLLSHYRQPVMHTTPMDGGGKQ